MNITDPIADMLTRIRNASEARHLEVTYAFSTLKIAIAQILRDEGYIMDFQEARTVLTAICSLQLKYIGSNSGGSKKAVISGIEAREQTGTAHLHQRPKSRR